MIALPGSVKAVADIECRRARRYPVAMGTGALAESNGDGRRRNVHEPFGSADERSANVPPRLLSVGEPSTSVPSRSVNCRLPRRLSR